MCNRISWQDVSAADAAKMLTLARALTYAGVQVMSFGLKCLCAVAIKSPTKSQKKVNKSQQAGRRGT
jgi:hypothetical protein